MMPEHIEKLKIAAALRRGVPLSSEHKAKISATISGRSKSQGHIANIRASRLGLALVSKYPNNLPKSVIERRRHLKKTYGITEEQFNEILAKQGGCCAICRREKLRNEKYKNWHIDHDHITGKFRGILCFNCNAALGQVHDDPTVLRYAIEYLECPR